MLLLRLSLAVTILTLIAGVLWFTHGHGYSAGAYATQQQWDEEKAATEIAQRGHEVALQTKMDQLRGKKDVEITRLNASVRALSDSLRHRPERPQAPASASAGADTSGCTGEQLYRADSEFLVRQAERADRIRLALTQCQAAYSAASAE